MLESLEFIQEILHHLNYFWVAVLMAIESSFIPFPSEVVVPPAAYLAANGKMNVVLVVLAATLGSNVGALVNYYLARYLGRPLVYRFAESKWGRMCLLSREKVEQAEAYFQKNGATSTLVGRLIPGIRQLISIPAGLSGMKLMPFLIYTTIGAGAWNIILAAIGYYLGHIVPEDQLIPTVMSCSKPIGIGITVVVVLVLVGMYLRKKRASQSNEMR